MTSNTHSNIRQWGEHGPTLVFLHYFGGSASSWQWVAEQLDDQFQCIAIDIPGFGDAPPVDQPSIEKLADAIQNTLEQYDIEKYTLIGHSMGAKIAVQMAINDSQNAIQQLLLVAPSPPTVEAMPAREKARMLQHHNQNVAEQTVTNAIKNSLPDGRHKLAIKTQLIIDPETWQWWLLEGMSHSIAPQASRLTLPISVLASRTDPVITMDTIQQEVLPTLPVQNLVWTNDAGHLLPLEAAEWLAAQIQEQIKNCTSPADAEPKIFYWHVWTDDKGTSRQSRVAFEQFEKQSMGGDAKAQWNKHLEASAVNLLFSELPVGWRGQWHENPKPQWIIPLSGRWFVETIDGQRVEMGPGDLSFGADQNTRESPDGHKGHLSGTVGGEPARLMIIQLESRWTAARPGAFSHSFDSKGTSSHLQQGN